MKSQIFISLLATALVAQLSTPVLGAREYSFQEGNYLLWWDLHEQVVEFKLTVKTTGWVGLGFGFNSYLAGSDIVVGFIDDTDMTAHHMDMHADINNVPTEDIQNDWFLRVGESSQGEYTILSYSRPLNTTDRNDQDLELFDRAIFVHWAYGLTDTLDWYEGDNRGNELINLFDDQYEVTTPGAPETTTPEAPETTTPEAPETTTPEAPETTTPEAPETTTPEAPETTTPEAPETTTPEAPETTTPEAPETTTPEAPETTTPDAPEPTTTEGPEPTTTGGPPPTTTVGPPTTTTGGPPTTTTGGPPTTTTGGPPTTTTGGPPTTTTEGELTTIPNGDESTTTQKGDETTAGVSQTGFSVLLLVAVSSIKIFL